MKKIPWYRWPENPMTGLVPWYVILRRLIFWPILALGIFMSTIALLLGHGHYAAKQFWNENT